MSIVCVYAILETAPEVPPAGVAGTRLRFLGAGGATLAVSDHAAPPKPDEPTLRAHDAAIRALCESSDAVLPARFGQTFPTDRALLDAVASRRAEIDEALTLVRGCVQMTLRISATATAPAPAPAAATGTAYLQSRARSLSLPELTPLRTALGDIVRAERISPASSPALPWRTSVFHLVPRTRITDYSAVLSRIAPTLPIPLTASGPWPPYAFADSILR